MLKRPVAFEFIPQNNAGVLATGNPLVWWLSIPALFYVLKNIRRAGFLSAETFIIVGFSAGYLPWFVLGRTPSYLYYVLPAVPFMCLAVAYVCCRLRRSRFGRGVVAAFAVATVGLFIFYYPVMAAVPIDYDAWRLRMIFRDCGNVVVRQGDRSLPFVGTARPPTGWCWI
jgi:dolichyl-phosphate-mannose--protein O-mannosyl transferase